MSSDFCIEEAAADDDLAFGDMGISLDIESQEEYSPAPQQPPMDLDPALCDGLDLLSDTSRKPIV